MNINDQTVYRGEVDAYVFDGDLDQSQLAAILDDRTRPEWSCLVSEDHTTNLVTNVGRQQMTKLIVAETTLGVGYMALSTTAVVPALADTALTNEFIRSAVTVKQSNTSYTQRYITYFATNSFASTAINGEGLFDAASTGGNMFAEAAITLSKTAAQSATVAHSITATTGV